VPEVDVQAVDLLHEERDRLPGSANLLALVGREPCSPRPEQLDLLRVEPARHAATLPAPIGDHCSRPQKSTGAPSDRVEPGVRLWITAVGKQAQSSGGGSRSHDRAPRLRRRQGQCCASGQLSSASSSPWVRFTFTATRVAAPTTISTIALLFGFLDSRSTD